MGKRLTILMYPWFAMGHLFPYVSTANKLAERGHKIFVIIPPKTRPKLDPLNSYPDHIEYIIHAHDHPSRGRPPPECRNHPRRPDLRGEPASPTRPRPVLQSLLSDLRPDFVFYDFMHWLPGLARDLGIKSIHYCTAGAAAASFLFAECDRFQQWIEQSKHAARGFHFFQTAKEMGSGITMSQRLITSFSDGDAIAFNACDEIEGDYCRFLQKSLNKPVLLAGPVTTPKPQSS
ncbi:hypothetical protein ACS0TY_031391 [Phlomoides rotata]